MPPPSPPPDTCSCNAADAAKDRPAVQSSTAFGGVYDAFSCEVQRRSDPVPDAGIPSRAVDGDADQNYASGSCTHTNRDTAPWWAVDLQDTVAVNTVLVWNRVDCCGGR